MISAQIEAWKGNYIAAVETPAPEMMELAKWLESNVPKQATSSMHCILETSCFLFVYVNCTEFHYCSAAVVHGDYRLGNLVFDPVQVSLLPVTFGIIVLL